MAHVGSVPSDKLLGQFIQSIEVVTGVSDSHRLETQPFHDIFDGFEILLLLTGRVGIVIAQIALASMVLGETKVDGNGFAVTDVEVPVGFGGKSCHDIIPHGSLVVDTVKETFLEHMLRITGGDGLPLGRLGVGWSSALGRLWLGLFLLLFRILFGALLGRFLLLGVLFGRFGGFSRSIGFGGVDGRSRAQGEVLWFLGLRRRRR